MLCAAGAKSRRLRPMADGSKIVDRRLERTENNTNQRGVGTSIANSRWENTTGNLNCAEGVRESLSSTKVVFAQLNPVSQLVIVAYKFKIKGLVPPEGLEPPTF